MTDRTNCTWRVLNFS